MAMMHLNLNVRVEHPKFGAGTVEGVEKVADKRMLRVKFDDDEKGKVRYFCAEREAFIAEMQTTFGER